MQSMPLRNAYMTTILFLIYFQHILAHSLRGKENQNISNVCSKSILTTLSQTEWVVYCENAQSIALSFTPFQAQSYILGGDPNVAVITAPSTLHQFQQVSLSSAFSQIAPLVSNAVTTLSIISEPEYIHPNAVTVASSAFTELTALLVLELQNFPIGNVALDITLPTSVENMTISGCEIQTLSFQIADDLSPIALSNINLSNNKLTEIPQAVYLLQSQLKILDLRANDLHPLYLSINEFQILSKWYKDGVVLLDKPTIILTCRQGEMFVISGVDDIPVCIIGDYISQGSDDFTSTIQGDEQIDDLETRNTVNYDHSSSSFNSDSAMVGSVEETRWAIIGLVIIGLMALVVGFLFLKMFRRRKLRDHSQTTNSRRKTDDNRRTSMLLYSEPGNTSFQEPPSQYVYSATINTPKLNTSSSIGLECEIQSQTPTNKISSPQKAFLLQRRRNRSQLREILMKIIQSQTAICVNQQLYICYGKLKETPLAFMIPCFSIDDCIGRTKLILKLFVTEDQAFMETEQHALTILQDNPHFDCSPRSLGCRSLEPETLGATLASFNPCIELDGMFCSVLVLEVGSCTSLRDVFLNIWERESNRESVFANHVYGLVRTVARLHSYRLVHGSLLLDHVFIHHGLNCLDLRRKQLELQWFRGLYRTSSSNVLDNLSPIKLMHLEHCVKVGECVRGYSSENLHYVPPELAHHILANNLVEDGLCMPEEDELFQGAELSAKPSLDIYCLGVCLLELYAAGRPFVAFDGCKERQDFLTRILDPNFTLDASIEEYVPPHSPMKHLIHLCLRRDPKRRPSAETLLQKHPYFKKMRKKSKQRLRSRGSSIGTFELSTVDELRNHCSLVEQEWETNSNRPNGIHILPLEDYFEPQPPTLWLILPPLEIGLDQTRTIQQYVTELSALLKKHPTVHFTAQSHGKNLMQELKFPLLFVCEESTNINQLCSSTCIQQCSPNFYMPLSLLSFAMPMVQETTLFIQAKTKLMARINPRESQSHAAHHTCCTTNECTINSYHNNSNVTQLSNGNISGLGDDQWFELMKFYAAIEQLSIAPISAFHKLMLKPLQEMITSDDINLVQQVLDELKSLTFCQDKRRHVRSILQVATADTPILNNSSSSLRNQANTDDWCGLAKYHDLRESSSQFMSNTRWLCTSHLV